MAEMEIDVWKGDWGLPSVDPDCLAVMAYCRFSQVPVKVNNTNKTSRWWRPEGTLPVFHHNDHSITRVSNIINYLRQQNCGCEYELTAKQSAELIAFSALLDEKLLPSYLYTWWMDSANYVQLTRPWYAKAVGFPLSFIIPVRLQVAAESFIMATKGNILQDYQPKDYEALVVRDAKECLNLLSNRLGDQEYFFGNRPTMLDAMVFGYLAPLLKAPFPSIGLQVHLKQCDNLVSLVHRVIWQYFPLTPEEAEEDRKRQEEIKKTAELDTEFPHRKRNITLAVVVALVSSVAYALLSGLVAIEITDVDEGDMDVIGPDEDHEKE